MVELTIVDAFTDTPFTGNPAAVALVTEHLEDELMHAVAREMSLPATAFVVSRRDGDHDLQWFSPSIELEFCGHATLASAHVLARSTRFHTKSGILACEPTSSGQVEMDFPAIISTEEEIPTRLGLDGVAWYGRGEFDVLIELADASSVRAFEPDLTVLATLESRAVIITAPGDEPGVDFVSRVFAPNAGIPEDPVTGSAHCALAVHWGDRLGRDELVGRQASPRGGTVCVKRRGQRVILGGSCVTVARTRLLL
jgi:predicted PhzF superfamily epimerase YddE/YHI9